MRLVKQDIRNIDECLKLNNIKYMDVRYELIDHLVSEYEAMENYPDLGSFLSERMPWCRAVAEKKQKSMPRRYQKAIWKMFLAIIKKRQTWFVVLVFAFLIYALVPQLPLRTIRWILVVPFFLCVLVQLYFLASVALKTTRANEMLSLVYLGNIFGLPWLFLFGFSWLPKEHLYNLYVMAPYILVGTLVNYATIKVFVKKRDGILEEYAFLKTYLA